MLHGAQGDVLRLPESPYRDGPKKLPWITIRLWRDASEIPIKKNIASLLRQVMTLWQQRNWEELARYAQPSWCEMTQDLQEKQGHPSGSVVAVERKVEALLGAVYFETWHTRRIGAGSVGTMRIAVVEMNNASYAGLTKAHKLTSVFTSVTLAQEFGGWFFNPTSAVAISMKMPTLPKHVK